MNVSKLISVLALSLGMASAALASGSDAPDSAAPVSRAEVLADLQIWQDSGLAALSNCDEGQAYTPPHDAAVARYTALRAAPSFAALVMRIAQRIGEKVMVAAAQ